MMRKSRSIGWFLIPVFIWFFMSAGTGLAQQVSVGSVVPITSLGTRTPIPLPTLIPEGGPLIFSDAPEIINDTYDLPGAMYRDQVQGEFRVFYHHQNKTTGTLNIGVALTNTTNQSVSYLTTLSAGQTCWSVQSVPVRDTASAILQYAVITLPAGDETTSLPLPLLQDLSPAPFSADGEFVNHPSLPATFGYGAVTVTTLAYSGLKPSDPTTIPVLPVVRDTRGTFPHFDRFGSFTISTAHGLQVLGLDTGPTKGMPGEYEVGIDAVDNDAKIYDVGNYGVLYNLRITVENKDTSQEAPFALLMWPSGGFGHYVMYTDGNLALSPYVNYEHAWWFDEFTLHGLPTVIDLEASLTGGSFGPQRLLFDPGFDGQ